MLKSRLTRVMFGLFLLAPFSLTMSGCDQDVAEVETPTGEVEIEEEPDGTLEVEED